MTTTQQMFDCVQFAAWILGHEEDVLLADFPTQEEYDAYNAGRSGWHKSPENDVIANFLSRTGEQYVVSGDGAYKKASESDAQYKWLPDYLRQTFRKHLRGHICDAHRALIALTYCSDDVLEIYHWKKFAEGEVGYPGKGTYHQAYKEAKIPSEFYSILANHPGVDPRFVDVWKAHL